MKSSGACIHVYSAEREVGATGSDKVGLDEVVDSAKWTDYMSNKHDEIRNLASRERYIQRK